MGRIRKKFSLEEKLKMVMAVIQDGKAVSDVAQENNVHPNMILNWKKEFLENAAAIFAIATVLIVFVSCSIIDLLSKALFEKKTVSFLNMLVDKIEIVRKNKMN